MNHVTEKNVDFISNQRLGKRYRDLNKFLNSQTVLLNPSLYESLKAEKELIEQNLLLRGATNQLSEQMVLPGFEMPKKEEYEDILIDILDQHRRKLIRLQKLQDRKIKLLETKTEFEIPSCTSTLSQVKVKGGSSEYQSSTEKAVLSYLDERDEIERQISELEADILPLKVLIETSLDYLERILIEKKYLSPNRKYDTEIISEMPVERSKFYELRREAFLHLAEALRII